MEVNHAKAIQEGSILEKKKEKTVKYWYNMNRYLQAS